MSVTRRHVLRGLAAAPLAAMLPAGMAAAESGHFVGSVVAQWGDNGLDMTLIQPFEFIGPDGQSWPVPAGARVDGASIPRVFWSLIGGPFEGLYRNASVVHDYYCDVKVRSYQAVHKAFYEAMVASGVDPAKAWLMFQAVNRFGPRWADAAPSGEPCGPTGQGNDFRPCMRGFAARAPAQPKVDKFELESFLADVEDKANPSDVAKLRQAIDKLQ